MSLRPSFSWGCCWVLVLTCAPHSAFAILTGLSVQAGQSAEWRSWIHQSLSQSTARVQDSLASGAVASNIEAGAEETSRRLLQRKTNHSGNASRHGRVLFIVYSDSHFYGTRVQWILKTWAGQLSADSLVIIGDVEATQSVAATVHSTRCPAHSHWEGACCKYAEAVVLAQKLMKMDGSFQWTYFTDDDAYVRGGQLENALVSQQPPIAGTHGLILGNFGCVANGCKPGLCAGGGYAASSAAVDSLVNDNITAFLEEEMQNCGRCERWADIALSQIFSRRGLEMRALQGLNGWQMSKSCFQKDLTSGNGPLMYHYVRSWNQMDFLHRLFLPTPPVSAGALRSNTTLGETCVQFHHNRFCCTDCPWLPAEAGAASCTLL